MLKANHSGLVLDNLKEGGVRMTVYLKYLVTGEVDTGTQCAAHEHAYVHILEAPIVRLKGPSHVWRPMCRNNSV